MDLQSEERETGIRRIPKCVGFNMPTKDDGLMEATAPRLPPDPTCLPSSSRRPTARADNTGTQGRGKGAGHKSRKREQRDKARECQ